MIFFGGAGGVLFYLASHFRGLKTIQMFFFELVDIIDI